MPKEKWILRDIYYDVFKKNKLYHSRNDFYDCFLKPSIDEYDISTKGKVISETRDFYKREKEYYAKKENRDKALEYLKALVEHVGNKVEKG